MKDIRLCDKYSCTQCMACVNICPQGCIEMEEETDGFCTPNIDRTRCVACGACMRSCHRMEKTVEYQNPLKTLACWTKIERDRRRSSSGGVFSVLARKVLNAGGVVYGATMDENLSVKHIFIESEKDIPLLQGSKYVQSYLGDIYKHVRTHLQKGRFVLFTGTPCQVGGLLVFLCKKYENLITSDVVCHGVPSQRVFDVFCEKMKLKNTCKRISFRFTEGWGFQLSRELVAPTKDGDSNSFSVVRKPVHPSNAWYMRAFGKGLMFSEACYKCAYSTQQRVSDFTMADYWGLGTKIPFNHPTRRGVSMLLVNNEKAWEYLKDCSDLFYEERTLAEAIEGNHNLSHSSLRPQGRETFLEDLQMMELRDFVRKYNIKESPRDYLRLLKQWIIGELL